MYDSVLKKLILANHKFKMITIEHDFYRYGDIYRSQERKILSNLGYQLVCPDVSHNGCIYEDWWVHPSFFSSNFISALCALDLRGKD